MDVDESTTPPPPPPPPPQGDLLVSLHDVIPCNLRVGGKFLSSTVRVPLNRNCLSTFLRCYGFMLYDRAEKVNTFAINADPAVREVAQLLNQVHDVESFRRDLYANISWAKLLLTDEIADSLELDNQEVVTILRRAAPDEESMQQPPRRQTGRQLLELARNTLEHVLNFLRDTDYLRRALNANSYCRQLFAGASSHVRDAWYDAQKCDLDGCLSIIIRDAIICTSEETHHTLLFVVRTALLFVFLVTQTLCGPTSQEVTVTVHLPAAGPSDDVAATREYFERLDTVTTEKMIATIFIAMARMKFVTSLEWPCRLLDMNGTTIDMGAIHHMLTRKLKMQSHETSSLRWLRVFAQRNSDQRRLYCNPDAILSMFAQIAQCFDSSSVDAAAAAAAAATSVRIHSVELRKQFNDYEALLTTCGQCIVANIRSHEHGLSPKDYAKVSPHYLHGGGGGGEDDDAKDFEEEVANILIFSVLALIRHDVTPYVDRLVHSSNSNNNLLTYDEKLDSYVVMLQHIYQSLYRAKISIGQTKNFISKMVTIWNENVGIVGFEQFGPIMLLIYQMFPHQE